jgi:predicted MPP superfamily phosphohydrolase
VSAAGPSAPLRRDLAQRPRAQRPPGCGPERPIGRTGRKITRWMRPLERSPLGPLLRGMLRRSCVLRRLELPLARVGPELDGLRIAMLSDLHVGFFFSEHEFAELAGRVSAWQPDLICLVGDLVDQEPHELALLRAGLCALRARSAVVAVPGNHDYAAEPQLKGLRELLESCGALPLWNRGLRVQRGAASLWIAGVDDLTAGEPDLVAALAGLAPEEPAVLLAHHPDFFLESAYAGVDLTLSGHTHGGQITWFGRPLLPGAHHTRAGHWQGLYAQDGAQLLVGRGAGVCVLPLRVAAPPEVLLIELRAAGGIAAPGC